jgi:hypothetical protein
MMGDTVPVQKKYALLTRTIVHALDVVQKIGDEKT